MASPLESLVLAALVLAIEAARLARDVVERRSCERCERAEVVEGSTSPASFPSCLPTFYNTDPHIDVCKLAGDKSVPQRMQPVISPTTQR